MAVTLAFLTSAQSTTDAGSYSFTSLSFGSAAADRRLVTAFHAVTGASPNTLSSAVSLGGETGAQVSTAAIVSGVALVEWWHALVPTGTTGQVDVTCGETQARGAIGLYSILGGHTSPSDSDETSTASAASISLSTVTIPTDGCGLFASTSGTGAITWTGATEDYDAAWSEGGQYSGASTTTPGTPTVTSDGATTVYAFAGIAFGPALVNKTLAADAGSMALTGTAATPKHGWKPVAAAGSMAVSGTAATPKHGWKTAAGGDSYALTGQAASGVLSGGGAFSIVANGGTMALTGTDAAPKHGWRITAAAGSMALAGVTATLKHGWKVAAAAGSYAVSGQDAAPKHGWKTTAAAGSMALTGTAASPELGRVVVAGAGVMALSGVSASIIYGGYDPEEGGIWIGDEELPYLDADGNPNLVTAAASANLATASGSANARTVQGLGIKYRVNRPH